MSNQNIRRIQIGIRAFIFLSGFILLCVSLYFSQDGFGVVVPEYQWVGWAVSIFGVTMLEIAMKVFPDSQEFFWGGVLAYIYGTITNIIGFWNIQGQPNYIDGPFLMIQGVVILIVAIFIEVIPERAMLAAIGVDGEMLSKMVGKLNNKPQNIAQRHQQQGQQQGFNPSWKPTPTKQTGQEKIYDYTDTRQFGE
jgi:hypothetical protein